MHPQDCVQLDKVAIPPIALAKIPSCSVKKLLKGIRVQRRWVDGYS